MTDDERDGIDWSDAERRAFASLERETPPPAGVEERVVAELASQGAFAGARTSDRTAGPARSPRSTMFAAAAAALLVFGAGVVVGRSAGVDRAAARAGTAAADAASPRFALFLLDEPPGGAAEEPARVAEYKRWAASLSGGRVVAGEKLGDEASLLYPEPSAASMSAAPDPASALRGYFVIQAPDLARALEVARTCPHLKRGGRILVRPIVPV